MGGGTQFDFTGFHSDSIGVTWIHLISFELIWFQLIPFQVRSGTPTLRATPPKRGAYTFKVSAALERATKKNTHRTGSNANKNIIEEQGGSGNYQKTRLQELCYIIYKTMLFYYYIIILFYYLIILLYCYKIVLLYSYYYIIIIS